MLWSSVVAVGPDTVAVCSAPSRRVAVAPPPLRGARGLDRVSAHGRHDTALARRRLNQTPQMLWSTSCPESGDLK